jgi:hypothetical protein
VQIEVRLLNRVRVLELPEEPADGRIVVTVGLCRWEKCGVWFVKRQVDHDFHSTRCRDRHWNIVKKLNG